MGEVAKRRLGDTTVQAQQILTGRALPGGRKHVQPQNGPDVVQQTLQPHGRARLPQHRAVHGRVHGSFLVPEKDERDLASALQPDDHDPQHLLVLRQDVRAAKSQHILTLGHGLRTISQVYSLTHFGADPRR